MFFLALVYLIILIVFGIFYPAWSDVRGRWGGLAAFILFLIIGFVLFWNVLNR